MENFNAFALVNHGSDNFAKDAINHVHQANQINHSSDNFIKSWGNL